MRAHFSEFTYGFALTHELVSTNRSALLGTPTFPSLYDEGQTGGGFDVGMDFLGYPLFLQFKLSEFMSMRSAAQWDTYNRNYYRIRLMPLRHSQQHNLLLQWERQGNIVYYAAPAFHTGQEMNNNFLNSMIGENSMFFSPSDIGQLPDDRDHCITFLPNDNYGYLWSEPKKVKTLSGKEFINSIEKVSLSEGQNDYQPVRINVNYLRELSQSIIKTVSEYKTISADIKGRINDQRPDLRVAYLSRIFLECEFLIIRVNE